MTKLHELIKAALLPLCLAATITPKPAEVPPNEAEDAILERLKTHRTQSQEYRRIVAMAVHSMTGMDIVKIHSALNMGKESEKSPFRMFQIVEVVKNDSSHSEAIGNFAMICHATDRRFINSDGDMMSFYVEEMDSEVSEADVNACLDNLTASQIRAMLRESRFDAVFRPLMEETPAEDAAPVTPPNEENEDEVAF